MADADTTTQRNQYLYLDPAQLAANEANEKARPNESPESRRKRVEEMAESIAANGQEYPVLVVEIDSDDAVTYEYVDGGCRVEAIAHLNERANFQPMQVWCSLLDPRSDLFRTAATANLHRTQNSILDMAYIVQEARERNGWKGRGTGQKIAEYLGLSPSRVSEYEKVLHAPQSVRQRIESGEIVSLDAALKLMGVPAAEQEHVAERAAEIAEEEQGDDREVHASNVRADDRNVGQHDSAPPAAMRGGAKTKVKAKHVARAAREVGHKSPRSKADILVFFAKLVINGYPAPVQAFAKYLAEWAAGSGTDKKLAELFDLAVGRKAKRSAKKAKGKK